MMKKTGAEVITLAGIILLTGISYALANESRSDGAPDYSGVTGIYYTVIGLILAYGVYDSFFRKSQGHSFHVLSRIRPLADVRLRTAGTRLTPPCPRLRG